MKSIARWMLTAALAVLVAGSVEAHAHHLPAFELLNAIQRKTMQGCISTHGLAEFYSVITRTPFSPRIPPFEAQRILDENIFPCFEIIALSAFAQFRSTVL